MVVRHEPYEGQQCVQRVPGLRPEDTQRGGSDAWPQSACRLWRPRSLGRTLDVPAPKSAAGELSSRRTRSKRGPSRTSRHSCPTPPGREPPDPPYPWPPSGRQARRGPRRATNLGRRGWSASRAGTMPRRSLGCLRPSCPIAACLAEFLCRLADRSSRHQILAFISARRGHGASRTASAAPRLQVAGSNHGS